MIQKRSKERGFTLIELLVVIAIIGVLSSVVLASLNSARGKGNDAKIKAQLSSARGSAEIFYSNQNPPSYDNGTLNMCDAPANDPSGIQQYLLGSNYPDSTAPNCGADAQNYAIWREMQFVDGGWCVDSKGASKSITDAQLGAMTDGSTVVCP